MSCFACIYRNYDFAFLGLGRSGSQDCCNRNAMSNSAGSQLGTHIALLGGGVGIDTQLLGEHNKPSNEIVRCWSKPVI